MNQESKKLKIGIFTTGLEPINKGTTKASEFFAFDLAEGLSKKGHEVHIFGAQGSEGNFVVLNPRHSVKTASNISGLYEYCAYTAMNFLDFLEYCKKNKIDIIHDQTSEMTITLSRLSAIPIVSTLHGVRPPSNLSEYYQLNRTIKFISPSNFLVKKSPDLSFYSVIPHGVDTEKFNFADKPDDCLLWLGRIIPEKGLDDAITATEIAGVKLKVAGYKPSYIKDSQYLDNVVERMKKSENIDFIGKAEREQIPKLFASAKALVMPTKCDEAFGLVVIEAMACGTPVIAYNRGPIGEIIKEGITGFTVEQNRPELLSEAIKKIFQMSKNEYSKMRRECREHVETSFSTQVMVDNYEKNYRKIILEKDKI